MANNSKYDRKEAKTFEISFPLILIRTKKGLSIIDKLSRLKFIKKLGWIFLYILPIVAFIGFYLILRTVIAFISNATLRGFAGQITPLANLLLPGINPYLPIIYGWIALIAGIMVHEGMHGILARSLGLSVKSSGLILFLILPIGAFVDVDENELKKSKAKDSSRVMAAGPGGNIITALIALLGLLIIVSTMVPLATGIGIVGVQKGYPAYESGIMPGDIIMAINGVQIDSILEADEILKNLSPGTTINLTIFHNKEIRNFTIKLAQDPQNSSRGIIGVSLTNIVQPLNAYLEIGSTSPLIYFLLPTLAPNNVPFSDVMYVFYKSSLGNAFYPIANLLFWIWFININLAIFNALPIYPLDGGQAFKVLLQVLGKNKLSERNIRRITYSVAIMVLSLIIMMITIPYLMI
ncbi:MAG: site-2 protease family protein [Nitrososphaerales archaeon]